MSEFQTDGTETEKARDANYYYVTCYIILLLLLYYMFLNSENNSLSCITCRSTVFSVERKSSSTDELIRIDNSHLVATVSALTGSLQKMSLKDSNVVVNTDLEFVQYGTRPGKERSGAYLFLPDGDAKVGQHADVMITLHYVTSE